TENLDSIGRRPERARWSLEWNPLNVSRPAKASTTASVGQTALAPRLVEGQRRGDRSVERVDASRAHQPRQAGARAACGTAQPRALVADDDDAALDEVEADQRGFGVTIESDHFEPFRARFAEGRRQRRNPTQPGVLDRAR